MALVQCNVCLRKHERPVGNRCDYYKRALEQCRLLGVSEDNYLQYLQPVQPNMAVMSTPSSGTVSEPTIPMSPKDVMAVLKDNAECKHLIYDQQAQLDNITGQIEHCAKIRENLDVTVEFYLYCLT